MLRARLAAALQASLLGRCSCVRFWRWQLPAAVGSAGEGSVPVPAPLAAAKGQRAARAWADVSSWVLGPSKGKCGFGAWGAFLLLQTQHG